MNDLTYKSFEIAKKEELVPGTFLLQMRGHLDFKPGQFVVSSLDHFGQITLAPCSDPQEKRYFELCIRATGSTSDAIDRLLTGEKLGIRGPYGNGWPTDQLRFKDIFLIAGGMGLVPLRPLLYSLHNSLLRKVKLFAGFKTPECVLFEKDLKSWSRKSEVRAIVEYADKNFWGEKGLITEPLASMKINPKKSVALICGPEIMYSHVIDVLHERGLEDDQIFLSYERRMECGIGVCQHCSCGKFLVCADGPVFRYDKMKNELNK